MFAQVVWKDSIEVGVGIAYGETVEMGSDGWTLVFIVARYNPVGNFILGKSRENVMPAKSGKSNLGKPLHIKTRFINHHL